MLLTDSVNRDSELEHAIYRAAVIAQAESPTGEVILFPQHFSFENRRTQGHAHQPELHPALLAEVTGQQHDIVAALIQRRKR
jgi:hypothetical protein